jgi:hypothetical protein
MIKLRREVRSGRLQVTASWPLIMELAGLYESDLRLYQRCLRALRELSRSKILLTRPDRVELELRKARRLRRGELFYPAENCERAFRRLATDSDVGEEKAYVEGFKEVFRKREIDARQEAREQIASKDRQGWIRAWRSDASSIVLDWCQDTLNERDPVPEINPRTLPSLWHHTGYHVARVYFVGAEGVGPSRIDPNDILDQDHFADAAYSNVLVSDDHGLRRIAEECPAPKVPVVDLAQWAQGFLSG